MPRRSDAEGGYRSGTHRAHGNRQGETPFSFKRWQADSTPKRADQVHWQPDERALFRYAMHTLPWEVDETIGTSTLFAAWNTAIYVGQIEDVRLDMVLGSRKYLDVTRDVLRKHGELWFWDESYSITRRRDCWDREIAQMCLIADGGNIHV